MAVPSVQDLMLWIGLIIIPPFTFIKALIKVVTVFEGIKRCSEAYGNLDDHCEMRLLTNQTDSCCPGDTIHVALLKSDIIMAID